MHFFGPTPAAAAATTLTVVTAPSSPSSCRSRSPLTHHHSQSASFYKAAEAHTNNNNNNNTTDQHSLGLAYSSTSRTGSGGSLLLVLEHAHSGGGGSSSHVCSPCSALPTHHHHRAGENFTFLKGSPIHDDRESNAMPNHPLVVDDADRAENFNFLLSASPEKRLSNPSPSISSHTADVIADDDCEQARKVKEALTSSSRTYAPLEAVGGSKKRTSAQSHPSSYSTVGCSHVVLRAGHGPVSPTVPHDAPSPQHHSGAPISRFALSHAHGVLSFNAVDYHHSHTSKKMPARSTALGSAVAGHGGGGRRLFSSHTAATPAVASSHSRETTGSRKVAPPAHNHSTLTQENLAAFRFCDEDDKGGSAMEGGDREQTCDSKPTSVLPPPLTTSAAAASSEQTGNGMTVDTTKLWAVGFVAPCGGLAAVDNPDESGNTDGAGKRMVSLLDDEQNCTHFTMRADPNLIKKIPRGKVPRGPAFSMRAWSTQLQEHKRRHRRKAPQQGKANSDDTHHGRRRISAREVAQHASRESMWMVIRGVVYDCTAFQKYHPGGSRLLGECAGKDATAIYDAFHPWICCESMMASCVVGVLDTESVQWM